MRSGGRIPAIDELHSRYLRPRVFGMRISQHNGQLLTSQTTCSCDAFLEYWGDGQPMKATLEADLCSPTPDHLGVKHTTPEYSSGVLTVPAKC